MTPNNEEPQLTRAQYRALKKKIDQADKTGSEIADEIQEHKQVSPTKQDHASRDARHRKSAAFNRGTTKDQTQVFKREEDLDAPRKFSADLLNQALYEEKNRPNKDTKPVQTENNQVRGERPQRRTNQDEHVVATARTRKTAEEQQNREVKPESSESLDKKKRLSFKERLFGPSNPEEIDGQSEKASQVASIKNASNQDATSSGNNYASDQFAQDDTANEDEKRPFFGPTKIDRFLNIGILLLALGIIILTIIAFYV